MFCLTESAASSYLCPPKTEDCGDVVDEEEAAAAAAAKTVPFSLAAAVVVVVVHYTVGWAHECGTRDGWRERE